MLYVNLVNYTRVITINSVIVQSGVDQDISWAIHAFEIYLDVSKMKEKKFAWWLHAWKLGLLITRYR